jgi:PTS system nitrogen regulatory IIA component
MVDDFFDIDGLAKYLHLHPEQVQKMAERGKLPGRRVANQWRFDKTEIFHWFENRIGLSDEEELKQVEKILDRQSAGSTPAAVKLSDYLTPELILIPSLSRSKVSLINDLCEFLAQQGRLWEPIKMANAIRAREDLHSTALENGVALLHPRRPQPQWIDSPFVALTKVDAGLPCGGPRGVLTKIFFLIASDEDGFHLKILARISRLLSQPDLIQQVLQSQSAQDAFETIYQFDSNLI